MPSLKCHPWLPSALGRSAACSCLRQPLQKAAAASSHGHGPSIHFTDGGGTQLCARPRAPDSVPPTAAPQAMSVNPVCLTGFRLKGISCWLKPLPPPRFLSFMGGKPLVLDQKGPETHMTFQVEPTAEPLTSESSPEHLWAELAGLAPAFTHAAGGGGAGDTPALRNPWERRDYGSCSQGWGVGGAMGGVLTPNHLRLAPGRPSSPPPGTSQVPK